MIEKLHDAGLRSEHACMAGLASIGLSFLAWTTSLKADKAGTDRAGRRGIFIGHWGRRGSGSTGNAGTWHGGSGGPGNYHGYLDVTGDERTSSVRVFLRTGRAGSGDIDRGIAGTLAGTKRLAEAGPAPGPAS
jgi:hypothetical protein